MSRKLSLTICQASSTISSLVISSGTGAVKSGSATSSSRQYDSRFTEFSSVREIEDDEINGNESSAVELEGDENTSPKESAIETPAVLKTWASFRISREEFESEEKVRVLS